jgi:hypothetical protein
LRDDESGFDRLSQANFISKDAPTEGNTLERKHHRVDLVRIRVDTALPLGGGLTPPLTRRPKPNEIFGKVTPVNGMAEVFSLECSWHRYVP